MTRRPFAQNFRQRIVRQYLVRFHMSLLLAATVASGVLCSKLLLIAGLHSVLYRYPLSTLGAYLIFTGLARLWVAYVLVNAVAANGHSFFSGRSSSSSGVDLTADLLPGGSSSGSSASFSSFGGGDAGGAGASDVWDSSTSQLVAPPTSSGSSGSGFHFPSLDLDFDFDDGFWILVVFGLLIAVIACAGGYLIWAAPEILPDLALSTLLTSSLTGAARRAQTQGWMVSVLRATVVPLLMILAVTVTLAVVMHNHCPGAEKLSTALACPDLMRPPT